MELVMPHACAGGSWLMTLAALFAGDSFLFIFNRFMTRTVDF